MGFWNTIKSINDALFDREAEAEYINSERYNKDTSIINNKNMIDKLINNIESSTSIDDKNRLLDRFNSIKQQNSIYYRTNTTITRKEALSMINNESNLIKRQSMKRLYKNGVYNFADLY